MPAGSPVSWLVARFREAPPAARLVDPAAVTARYALLRRRVLVASMVAYGLFYFCRKNLSPSIPLMGADAELHLTNLELGVLGSTFSVSYGVSKLASGLVADRAGPRVFLATGLVLSVVCNVLFGLSSSLQVFALVWALNGLVQSTGATACAKILASWFGPSERGTMTAIWNISHQGGGGLVLVIAGTIARHAGWRWAMAGPALLALGVSLLVVPFLYDRPETEGLPPVEEHRKDPLAAPDDAADLPPLRLFLERVLSNRRVWICALASGCTYVVRYGALDWMPKYLREVHHQEIDDAAFFASLLEFAGIPGALLCAWLSDRFFGSRRAPVVGTSLVLLAASTWLLFRVPTDQPVLRGALLGCMGFFTYGPQALLAGVAPIDLSSKRVAAAAVGFTGLVSYLGAAAMGPVTGWLIDRFRSYEHAFDFWAGAALAGALLCIPLWRSSPGRP